MTENNNGTEYQLRCEYIREVGESGGFGTSCSAPEGCIYNNHQIISECVKGCNVGGIVPRLDLSEDIKKRLNDKDESLIGRVIEVTKIVVPK